MFIHRNDPFTCLYCGAENDPAEKTCRDHCRVCLYSRHVDTSPGDRLADCEGLMKPVGVQTKGDGSMQSIEYRCEKCGYQYRNKIAEDDDKEALMEVYRKNVSF